MQGHRLALYTFGIFRKPADDPVNRGFHRRNDPILRHIERCAGFIARAGYDDEPRSTLWGEQVYPRFYVERGDFWSPATLSLWQDPESAMAFAYHGLHKEALALGRDWFVEPQWPPYVAWWVAADHRPDWAEAVQRHEALHDHGPTARAFDFRHGFAPDGSARPLDAARLKALVAENAGRAGAGASA